jgi:hypothetical protein
MHRSGTEDSNNTWQHRHAGLGVRRQAVKNLPAEGQVMGRCAQAVLPGKHSSPGDPHEWHTSLMCRALVRQKASRGAKPAAVRKDSAAELH